MDEADFVVELKPLGKNVSVRRVAMPEKVMDPETPVLFLGEGDFTFSMAFACLRHSWRNVFATSYHSEKPAFAEAQVLTIRNILRNRRECSPDAPVLQYIDTIAGFKTEDNPWQQAVDALSLPHNLPVDVVWFQCPWVTKWKRTPDLLKSFFSKMGDLQQPGDLVVLGIISRPPYCESYLLNELSEGTDHYELLGGDNRMIQDLLDRGYRHQGIREIHSIIYRTHISLIFQHR
jgi:hypothetical protein